MISECILNHNVLSPNINQTQAEVRAEFAERGVQKLQKEVDRLEGTYSPTNLNSIIDNNICKRGSLNDPLQSQYFLCISNSKQSKLDEDLSFVS